MSKIQIHIDDNIKIAYIQKKFNDIYPYLWMEFYDKDLDDSHPASKRISVVDGMTVGDCRKTHDEGNLIVFPEMSVADLESILFQSFGISIQVLRKVGKVWLETAQTDSWSLEQQNRQGEVISTYMSKQEEKRKGN